MTQTSLGSSPYVTAKFHYNKDGQTRLAVRWISAGYYVLTVNKYDAVDGRLLRVEHKRSNQEPSYSAATDAINYNSGTLVPLTTLMYAFDDDGRMVSKTRILFDSSGSPLRTNQFNFAYDSLGRLIGESYDLGIADGQFSRSYEYNNTGNRTVKYEDGVRTNYSYATLSSQHTNQLSTAAVVGGQTTKYLYDAMGNLTAAFVDSNSNNVFDTASENGKAYAWNLAGQLTQVKVWSSGTNTDTAQYTYAHNGTGQLLDRTVNGDTTRFHWNGFSPYLEEDDNGDAEYSYFGSSIRFDLGSNNVIDTSDDAHFLIKEEAGNVIASLNKTGSLETQFEYDAWGNDLNNSFNNSQDINSFRSGKYFDNETGLYYNQARWYDPDLGRFISESPIAPFAEEEYAYCSNDPVNYVDVNGLEKTLREKACDALAGPLEYLFDKTLKPILDTLIPQNRSNAPPGLSPNGKCSSNVSDDLGDLADVAGEEMLSFAEDRFPPLEGLFFLSSLSLKITDYMNPNKIRFTQDSHGYDFKDGHSYDKLVEGLKSGKIKPNQIPPIRVFEEGGKIWTLDNRRLHAFQEAGVPIRTILATPSEIGRRDITTINDGLSIIRRKRR